MPCFENKAALDLLQPSVAIVSEQTNFKVSISVWAQSVFHSRQSEHNSRNPSLSQHQAQHHTVIDYFVNTIGNNPET